MSSAWIGVTSCDNSASEIIFCKFVIFPFLVFVEKINPLDLGGKFSLQSFLGFGAFLNRGHAMLPGRRYNPANGLPSTINADVLKKQPQRAGKLEIGAHDLRDLPAHALVTGVVDVDVDHVGRATRGKHHQLIVVANDMRLVTGTPTIATALRW